MLWKSDRQAIGESLASEAAWVHQELESADAFEIPVREDAITSFVLLHLRQRLSADLLSIKTYSAVEEGTRTGADWEWWFGDGTGTPYLGMRVQAKKLQRAPSGPGYDFTHVTKSTGKLQIDTFRNSAYAAGLPAIYALYNGTFSLSDFPWMCCGPVSKSIFGVSMLAADMADALRIAGTTTLADVGACSRPWSCLMLCPRWLSDGPVPTPFGEPPGLGLRFASDLIGSLFDRGPAQPETAGDGLGSPAISGAVRSWDDLPDYVRSLVEDRFYDFNESPPPPLSGVAVFSVGR